MEKEEQKKSFREDLIERIGNRSTVPECKYFKLFELVLLDGNPKEIFSKSCVVKPVAHFPIQESTCHIIENNGGVGLCFNSKTFLLTCIGKKKIDSLNNNYNKLKKTLQNIENVLGKVAVVDELRKELIDYQKAVGQVFGFIKEELNNDKT